MKKEFKPRACLSGKDIADLLEGRMVPAYGVEFVYDGLDIAKIQQALEGLGKRFSPQEPRQARQATARA